MKIMITLPNLQLGGVQSFAAALACQLASDGDEITMLVFDGEMSDRFTYLRNSPNLKLEFLHKGRGFSFAFLRRLNKAIKAIDPDVINSHSSRTLRYLFLLSECKKRPIVHVITNNPRIYNKKLFWLYRHRLHQKSWSNIHLVGISDSVTTMFLDVYGIDSGRITTIYNGIQIPNVDAKEQPTDLAKPVLFNCASLTEIKNQKILIDALAKLTTATLVIAGDGPCRESLRQQTKELGLEDRVTFLGYIDDPSPYYAKATHFVLSSTSEGSPISILEALSYGLPVIAPRVGGIPDLIHEENGWLFDDTSDYADILKALSKAVAIDQERYSLMSKANIALAKRWDIRLIAGQYRELMLRYREDKGQ